MSATLQIHPLITPHENAGKLQLLSPFADEETEAQSGSMIAQGLNSLTEEAGLELWSKSDTKTHIILIFKMCTGPWRTPL